MMAICNSSGAQMLTADDCVWNRTGEDEDWTIIPAIPFNPECAEPGERCGDCGVAIGKYHHPGCDIEICPRCQCQLISCNCRVKESELELAAPLPSVEPEPADKGVIYK